jgi:hypothetical protein
MAGRGRIEPDDRRNFGLRAQFADLFPDVAGKDVDRLGPMASRGLSWSDAELVLGVKCRIPKTL